MGGASQKGPPLSPLACRSPDCGDFSRFRAGNLSAAQRIGRHKAIWCLYCRTCGYRFGQRQGSLLRYAKLPLDTIVRVIKCLGHGASEADPRSASRLLQRAGTRADHFSRKRLEYLRVPREALELDEFERPRGKRQNATAR